MLKLPSVAEDYLHVYHQYVVRSGQRDKLRVLLEKQGVGTQIHYPMPVHQQPAYRHLRADCPVTNAVAGEILSLPMYSQLSTQEVDRVCELIVAHQG
jgi:dTDP-4-amino-4,6-dideoxygalactose transaminase